MEKYNAVTRRVEDIMTIQHKTIQEPFEGSGTMTKVFTRPMQGFVISNDGTSSLTFTIGSTECRVLPGEVFEGHFEPFSAVTVTTATPFRAHGLG